MSDHFKAVFSDIDGTLLDSNYKIGNRTKQCVERLTERQIPFVLVSARMPSGVRGYREELGGNNPMICYSGALVLDQKETPVLSVEIEKALLKCLVQMIHNLDRNMSISIYRDDEWCVEQLDQWVRQEMEITKLTPIVRTSVAACEEGAHKVLVMGVADQIELLETRIIERELDVVVYRSKDTYLEIMAKSVSKAGGIAAICREMGIDREETICFGDYYNDIDMLEYAGKGVAMGNAPKQIRDVADYVTGTNDEDGISQVLELMLM